MGGGGLGWFWQVPMVSRPLFERERSSGALRTLNKCFVSVLSLLFITNKYLSTESLVPRCFVLIHYCWHLVVLFRSPSSRGATFPFGVLQLSVRWERAGGCCPSARPRKLGVPHSVPSPEALPPLGLQSQRLHCVLRFPRRCPSAVFLYFISQNNNLVSQISCLRILRKRRCSTFLQVFRSDSSTCPTRSRSTFSSSQHKYQL